MIELRNIERSYPVGASRFWVLRRIDLEIKEGEFITIMGPSGAGKSTLLAILGMLDGVFDGEYFFLGNPVHKLNTKKRAELNKAYIGFVFQGFNLLARTTALENVELPLLYDRNHRVHNPRQSSIEALERVGLGERLHHVPNQLSGGQQQRVAIARALVTRPAIILADEPTGNLDSRTTLEVMALFQRLNREGMTLVLVTHEPEVARYAGRLVELRDGQLRRDVAIAQSRDAAADLAEPPEDLL